MPAEALQQQLAAVETELDSKSRELTMSSQLQAELRAFYGHHEPSKVQLVPALLESYSLGALCGALLTKYGAVPLGWPDLTSLLCLVRI